MTPPRRRLFAFSLRTLFALSAASLLLSGDSAHGQLAPGSAPKLKLRARNSAVVKDLSFKNFAALDANQFDEFFIDYYLQLFAHPDFVRPAPAHEKKNETTNKLNFLRNELRTRYFGAGKSGAPYNRLKNLTFQMMRDIIEGDFPISVKKNATLVIGELSDTEFNAADGTKLIPCAKALDYLNQMVKSGETPDDLRAAAMLGIKRHAEINSK